MADTAATATGFNLFDPRLWDDPFPAFAALRKDTPVLKVQQPGMSREMFLITSRELILQILQDPERYSSRFYEVLAGGGAPNPEAARIYATGWPEVDVMLTTDGAAHERFRSLVNAVFSPRRIAAMQPKILDATERLIDAFIEAGECDFIEQFAVPLPIYLVSDMMGIPRESFRRFRQWSDAFILRNGQMGTPEQEVEAAKLIVECQRYLHDLVQRRRVQPEDDMISDLAHAGGTTLSDVEILSILQQILIAGNETTRGALIGLLAHLLRHPDQLQSLRDNPALVPNAVEEALRCETPAACTWRIAREDLELGGVAIPAGSILMARLDAANRDEAFYANPDAFNIARESARQHLAFGQGIHYCVGHALARRELTTALPRLLDRLQELRMVPEKSDLRIHTSVHIRALRALAIRFRPSPRLSGPTPLP